MAHPLTLQLRNLQSLVEIGVDKNTTVVFPAPLMTTIAELGSFLTREATAAGPLAAAAAVSPPRAGSRCQRGRRQRGGRERRCRERRCRTGLAHPPVREPHRGPPQRLLRGEEARPHSLGTRTAGRGRHGTRRVIRRAAG
jgi:hypothetical protein